MRWYVVFFYTRYLDFRTQEFESLASLFGCEVPLLWKKTEDDDADEAQIIFNPIRIVQLPNDAVAAQIASRTSLVKYIAHLWGEGKTDEELREDVKRNIVARGEDERFGVGEHLTEEKTFKLVCCDRRTKVGEKTKKPKQSVECARRLGNVVPHAFEPKGKVDLRDPKVVFLSCEVASSGADDLGFEGSRMYFGRVVGSDASRRRINVLDLKKRRYLGPTTMDAHMSLIMCNMVKVENSHGGPVLDPLCGTGSVLLAAAELGCLTCGFEIDPRVLEFGKIDKKTGEKMNVLTNFVDYGFEKPVFLIRGDVHASPLLKISNTSDERRLEGVFQAIVADPPYGVRERGRKSQFGGRKGKKEEDMLERERKAKEKDDNWEDHIPSTVPYSLTEINDDIVELSAKTLPVGGRICFFIPADVRQKSPEADFPSHPCMKVVAHSLQPFSTTWGRRLVTLEKTKHFSLEEHLQHEKVREMKRKENIQNGVADLSSRVRALVYKPANETARNRKHVKCSHQEETRAEFFNGVVPDATVVLERREKYKASKIKDKQFKRRGKYT